MDPASNPTLAPHFELPLLVGVAGHRDLVAAQVPAIRAAVENLLRELQGAHPDVRLKLLCPMAEGADLLVADVALDLGVDVLALLTFPRDVCRAELSTDEARAVFDRVCARGELLAVPTPPDAAIADFSRPGAVRDQQFQRAGLIVAQYSTLLIAIWDGLPTSHPAGTARVVDFRRRGVSLADEPGGAPGDVLLTGHENDLTYHIRCARGSTVPASAAESAVTVVGFVTGDGAHDSAGTPTSATLRKLLERTAQFNQDVREFAVAIDSGGRRLSQPSPFPIADNLQYVDRLFTATDWLGGHYRKCFTRALKLRYSIWALMAFLLLAFKKFSTGALGLTVIVAVLVMFLSGTALAAWAHRRQWHRKYLDYRALAEALRIDYYWEVAGVRRRFAGEFAHESFLQRQDAELEWIRSAMRTVSLRLALSPSAQTSAGFAHAYAQWVGDDDPVNGSGQMLYYRERASSLHRRLHTSERVDRAMLATGLGLAITFVADIVFELLGYTLLPNNVRGSLLWALALLTAYAAIFEIYLNEKADRTLIRQYRYMHSLFRFAGRELKSARSDNDKLDILRALGHACLAEHAQWILAHRDKRIQGLKW